MKLRNYGNKRYIFLFFTLLNILIFGVLNNTSFNNHVTYPNNPQSSGIISYLDKQLVDNPTFIPPVDPWYPSITGDSSDVASTTSLNQANYVVIGESRQKQVILNSSTASSWNPFNKTKLVPNLGIGFDANGVYTAHEWNETIGPQNTPSINWKLPVNMGVDMSNFIITSVTFDAVINATVDQDIDTPGDIMANWNSSIVDQFQFYDYAQFYIEITDLTLNEISTYRIAFNQTRWLGHDFPTDYKMQKSIESETEQTIINILNNVLNIDPGHNNFVVVLGINIYCEDNVADNVFGWSDSDPWDELRFKTLNLTISYEKKINRFSTVSWNLDLNKITGSYVKITSANFSFKFKMNQNWSIASPNSELRIYINDRSHQETINLLNYTYSPSFQDAKIGGFNISSIILPYENFTLSIQLFLAENFRLGSNITISITDVYLYVSYTEFYPDSPIFDILNVVGPFLLAGIFIAVSIVLASILHRTPKQRGLKNLSFTTGYPKNLKPDKPYWLSVYLHLPKSKDNVADLIDDKHKEGGFESYIPTKESIMELNCVVTLKMIPNVNNITFEPIRQDIIWDTNPKEISFRLNADSKDINKTLNGTIDIFKENLFIGQIPLSFSVSQDEKPTEVAKVEGKKFASTFVSYSYENVDIVYPLIEAYKSIGIRVIDANDDIYSGKWEKPARKLIYKSDVFQLFWSTESIKSKGVEIEWKLALELLDQRGDHFIRGCYWETHLPKIPKELSRFKYRKINLRTLDLRRKIKKKYTKKR
ncbi:hypothetical protein LCGC14_1089730 [marine sediment metagenome]|uniref:TIR domain-containing protein n=1 Tax=marine sediment metagenome TaxID=412755 RepID=A0A0F9MH70_9ZZZZ